MGRSQILLFFFLLSFSLYPQNPEWINYTSGRDIRTLCFEDGYVWVGTSTGLVKISKTTEQTVFFDKANSPLPDNNVQAIAIDSSGNKWVGTSNGLIKFDGSYWTIYSTSNSGLPHNTIYAIEIDNEQNLWIGTEAGLAKFDGKTWVVYHTANSGLISNSIRSIVIDKAGLKWIGTSKSGIAKFDGFNWTTYTISNSDLPSNTILTIFIDKSDTKWIGTPRGLAELVGNYWTIYDYTNSESLAYPVTAIAIDAFGYKWIGTDGGGISKFKEGLWIQYGIDNTKKNISLIKIDKAGDKWIGSAGGIFKIGNNSNLPINTSSSGLLDNTIFAMANDNYGNWCFGNINGLTTFDGTNWKTYTSENSLLPNDYSLYPYNPVTAVAIDAQNKILIGNSAGFSILVPPDLWYKYTTTNSSLPANNIKSIIDNLGTKWIGTTNGALKLHNSWWVVYNTSNSGLPDNIVKTITIDEAGNKWFGTKGGIAKFNDTTWTTYTTSNSGLHNNTVQSIATDDSGNIWIGTPTGLAQFDGVNWKTFTTSNSGLPNNNVYSIAVEGSKNKWIGTYGGGLVKYDGSNWTVFTKTNSGLFDNYISALAIDKSGNKWIGTTTGGVAIYKDIIPIELVSFIGSIINSVVQLQWKTTSETNNAGWYVQRKKAWSKDYWKTVQFIQGSGTSQQTNEYFFEDKNLDTTHSYQYRLGQLDVDGSVRYSNTIAVYFPVPVELISFSASILANEVQLHWVTATESNNKGWSIQRKTSKETYWNTIAFVDGKGTSTEINNYKYKDHPIANTNAYQYRLEQIDFGGSVSYSKKNDVVYGIPEKFELQQNYPNPFNPTTKIKFSVETRCGVPLRVYDVLGSEVATLVNEEKQPGNYEVNFNTQQTTNNRQLSSGVYFYQLRSSFGGGSFVQTKKMIVLK